jgi:multimeric flavodoxin WrbA
VLVCGSPVYCHYPSANFRAFMERLIFPVVNYSDFMHPIVLKPKHSAAIFTMNCPNDQMYQGNGYDILMDMSARQLGISVPPRSCVLTTPISSMTTAAMMPLRLMPLTRLLCMSLNSRKTLKMPTG